MIFSRITLVLAVLFVVVATPHVSAAIVFSDDFSTYSDGTGITATTGTITAPGGTWSLDTTATLLDATDYFRVEGGALEALDTDGAAIWTSQVINTTGVVDFSLDGISVGVLEPANVFDVAYNVDGGGFVTIADFAGLGDPSHALIGNWGTINVMQTGINTETSVQLRETTMNIADLEQIRLDNVTVHSIIEAVPEVSALALLFFGFGFCFVGHRHH